VVGAAEARDNAAKTTNNEFIALSIRVRPQAAIGQLRTLSHFASLAIRREGAVADLKNQLVNGTLNESLKSQVAASRLTLCLERDSGSNDSGSKLAIDTLRSQKTGHRLGRRKSARFLVAPSMSVSKFAG